MNTFPVPGALLAATALLLACAAPADAGPTARAGGDHLYLTVTKGDAHSSDTRGTLLSCDPPQGHARAAEACAQLRAVRGDIDAVPDRHLYCSTLYAPVTADARGRWNGRPVNYRRTFSNACLLAARTGAVFALDGLPGSRRTAAT
ncbi:SSI family serine proteinase inhibitor [Streptomyces sp. NPDC101249]|uniref:SSI family serine proteinase inhibitor n=1 Tax=Streptomyces sp. NPDC101249 TaxID=3366140 RepID=UPI00381D02FB